MNPFDHIIYQLHLLQLENYELQRYWPLLLKKGYHKPSQPLRQKITYTKKALTLLALSLTLCLLLSATIILLGFSWLYALICLAILFFLQPFFFTISLCLIWPLDWLIKKYLINKAKKLISSNPKLRIIGIAGSYGKTTFKNILNTILGSALSVQSTPESVNTTVGIAQWLLKCYDKNTDILIVEMGEHYQGDIRDICRLTSPHIAVVTGINEAHLERLGDLKTAVATMFEISQNAQKNAWLVLNADDTNIAANYQAYIKEQTISFYSANNHPLAAEAIEAAHFSPEDLSWHLTLNDWPDIKIPLLGHYALGAVAAAIMITRHFNLTNQQIQHGLLALKPIKHRLQAIQSQGDVLVIDDSYNGNPDGFKEAIRVLNNFPERRKIMLTPGLVETGSQNQAIHSELGWLLAKTADKVILIKNSATPFLAEGLKEGGFTEENIYWFPTAQAAHEALKNILKPHDVILFQNDWGDQYL